MIAKYIGNKYKSHGTKIANCTEQKYEIIRIGVAKLYGTDYNILYEEG